MPTLLKKGITGPQCLAVFLGACAAGFLWARDHRSVMNSHMLVDMERIDAQSRLVRMLYGPVDRAVRDTLAPRWNPLQSVWFYEYRGPAFASVVAMEEAKIKVDQWRQATNDPDAAGYKICYGPQNYVHEHVCNDYCIHPSEIKKAKKDMNIKFPNQLSQGNTDGI